MKKRPTIHLLSLPGTVRPDNAAIVRSRLNPALNTPFFETVGKLEAMVAKRCDHSQHGMRLDQMDRRVYCRGCGISVDPFEALLIFAHAEQRLVQQVKALADARDADARAKQREKDRRPFLRRATGWKPVKDEKLKAEPIIGWQVTLACGHTILAMTQRQPKTMTCPNCQALAATAP